MTELEELKLEVLGLRCRLADAVNRYSMSLRWDQLIPYWDRPFFSDCYLRVGGIYGDPKIELATGAIHSSALISTESAVVKARLGCAVDLSVLDVEQHLSCRRRVYEHAEAEKAREDEVEAEIAKLPRAVGDAIRQLRARVAELGRIK